MTATCIPALLDVFCDWLPSPSAISVISAAKSGAGEKLRFVQSNVMVDEHANRSIVVARTPIIAR